MRLASQTTSLSRLTATLFAIFFAAGCHSQPKSSLRLDAQVKPVSPPVGPATIRIQLFDQSSHPVTDARISVEADMTHPGMKPVFADAVATSGNEYEAKLIFDMPGDWILLIRAIPHSGATVEKQLNLTVKATER